MLKLLVVEDNLVMRKLIKESVLRTFKTEAIYEVDNGYDAIKIGNEKSVNLIIADIGLPDISGIEVIKRLRLNPLHYTTPVIFITADPTKELEAYRHTHCHSYLTKPFAEETLIDLINRLNQSSVETEVVKENKLLLKFKTHGQWVYEKDIYYVEYVNRKVRLYFIDSYVDYKTMPLKEFSALLSDQFIQIHQSIIINSNKIKSINCSDNLVCLFDQPMALPIGRNYINFAKKLLLCK